MSSDRLKNKVGDRITPQEWSDMHDAVNAHMKSEAHWMRFRRLTEPAPNMSVPATNSGPIVELANRFERSIIKQHGKLGLTVAYSFGGLCLTRCLKEGEMHGIVGRPAFLMVWPCGWKCPPLLAIVVRFPYCDFNVHQ